MMLFITKLIYRFLGLAGDCLGLDNDLGLDDLGLAGEREGLPHSDRHDSNLL